MYAADLKTASAVERQLGITGEAVNHCRREPAAAPLPDTVALVRFRNILIHSCDTIQPRTVWSIVQNNLPVLRAEVKRLLATPTRTTAAIESRPENRFSPYFKI